jgi:type I restriction-modification system DNA methylase subunit
LIFLKYIHDAFEERRDQLRTAVADPKGDSFVRDPSDWPAVLEDRDEYLSHGILWVPVLARWLNIQGKAKQPTIGNSPTRTWLGLAEPTMPGAGTRRRGRCGSSRRRRRDWMGRL